MSNTTDKQLLSEKELEDMRMIAFNSYDDFSKYAAAKILQMHDHIDGLKRTVARLQSGAFDIPNNRFASVLMHIQDRLRWGDPENAIDAVQKTILEALNTSVTEPSVDRVNDNPIAQAIREFMPTAEQRAGYEALCAWLESVTSFELEGGNEG